MNEDAFDANLLFLFHALMKHQSVSAAAAALGISQSAASKALAKLRGHYGDPLFLKSMDGMMPTERALALAPIVEQSTALIGQAVGLNRAFDPARAERTITLSLMDLTEMNVVARLLPRLRSEAPRCRLRIVDGGGDELVSALEAGGVDLVIGVPVRFGGGVHQQKLFEHDFVIVVHGDNRIDGSISLTEFSALDHLVIEPPRGTRNSLGSWLLRHGADNGVLETPHGLAAPYLVSQLANAATILPRQVAEVHCRHYPLKILEPNFPLPVIEVFQYWHARADNDPFSLWLRSLVRSLLFHAPEMHLAQPRYSLVE